MKIIRKIRQESSAFVPNVLDKVLARVGYLPTPKKAFWTLKRMSVLSMSAAMTIAAAIVIPYYINKAVVTDALTTIELTITPASVIDLSNPISIQPIFVYQVDELFKTKAIDSEGLNAVYAKNDEAKIILAGVGRQNTTGRAATDVAVDIVDKAATAGYIELAGQGNLVTVAAIGSNDALCTSLEDSIYSSVMGYFRDHKIYGTVTVSETTDATFEGYDEETDEAEVSQDEEDYDNSATEHGHDDENRDSEWDSSYDTWMTEHDDHGNHGDHGNHNSNSENSSSNPNSSNEHHN